jgi:hypothetical protein
LKYILGVNKINKSKKILNEEKKKQRMIQKQDEIAKQKVMKQLNLNNRLKNNPDYKLKLMEIIFDKGIKNYDFFSQFLKHAQVNDLKYKVQSELIPNSMTFYRNIENHYVNEKNELYSNLQTINENHVVIIWNSEETIKYIFNNTFTSTISNIKLLIPNKKLSLIIYKIDNYFKYLKSVKDQSMQEEISRKLSNLIDYTCSKFK